MLTGGKGHVLKFQAFSAILQPDTTQLVLFHPNRQISNGTQH